MSHKLIHRDVLIKIPKCLFTTAFIFYISVQPQSKKKNINVNTNTTNVYIPSRIIGLCIVIIIIINSIIFKCLLILHHFAGAEEKAITLCFSGLRSTD